MRAITNNNYIETCSDLIVAFGAALAIVADADREGTIEHEETSEAAFELAKDCGWIAEDDVEFATYALKATSQEILVEGLQRALASARAQLDTYLTKKGA